MANIDELVIKVRADIDDAITGIEKVEKALGKISVSTSSASDAISRISLEPIKESITTINGASDSLDNLKISTDLVTEGMGSACDGTDNFISRLFNLASIVKKSDKTFSSLFTRIKRIVGYRIIRGVFNQIISGFREGVNNLILFERYLGDSSLMRGTEIMNSLATSLQTLKNSLGSMSMAILGALKPILEWGMSALTNIANKVNQFFVALQGGDTWLKATDSAYDYSNALKEVKRQTFGFDELNVFSGSGVNAGNTSYNTMFEPALVSTNIANLAGTITNLYEQIKPFIDEIKGFFATNFSLDNLGTAFSNISTTIKDNIDDIAKFMSGALLGVGAVMLATGQIGLGIGLIASSALNAYATGVDGGALKSIFDTVKEHFEEISSFVVGASLCAGALLLLTPAYGIGLGLLALGLASVVAPIMFDDTATRTVKEKLSAISLFAGASLLAIGLILALANPLTSKLGIGLMFAGATGLATAVSLNWGHFQVKIQQFLLDIEDLWLEFTNYLKKQWNSLVDWYNGSIFADIFGKSNNKLELELTNKQKEYAFNEWQLGYDVFASGGIPSKGSLFLAGESSSAEIVGQFGGRTNVINQDQLTYSMREANRDTVNAIYAMANAIVSSVDNIEMPSIRIGDREIYNASQRGKKIVGSSLVQGV